MYNGVCQAQASPAGSNESAWTDMEEEERVLQELERKPEEEKSAIVLFAEGLLEQRVSREKSRKREQAQLLQLQLGSLAARAGQSQLACQAAPQPAAPWQPLGQPLGRARPPQ